MRKTKKALKMIEKKFEKELSKNFQRETNKNLNLIKRLK